MLNVKLYAILALALAFVSAAPAQAGNTFQWPSAPQYSSAAPGYEAYASSRNRRRLPSASISTPAPKRPVMTGHTGHHRGH